MLGTRLNAPAALCAKERVKESPHPLIPAKAGTQFLRKMPAQAKIKASYEEDWVPAFAGMSGWVSSPDLP
jgi:hypothetical protein